MGEQKFDFEEIRAQVSLVSFLRQLGYEPVRYSGGEHFYRSMLRDGDRIPSFCVNDKLGFWYDHGLGKGGTVIDLAKEYWPTLDFKEAVSKMLSTMGAAPLDVMSILPKVKQLEIPLRYPSYQIAEDRPIGSNDKISAYLKSRGIYEASLSHLRELYYSVKPEGKERMSFSAAAWKNDLGGWEIRNASFKGCLGKKGINFIPSNPDKICLFEGMMDFLSWKVQWPKDQSSVLILNSLSMLNHSLEKAKNYSIIDIFFDHDLAGRKATSEIQQQLPWSVDQSGIYQGYNDFNEKLQASYLSNLGTNTNSKDPLQDRQIRNR